MTTVYKACSLEDFRYICNTKRFYITPHAFTYDICQDDRIDSSTTCVWFVLQSETCMNENYSMLISVRELAKRIKKDKSTAARALKTLEKYGYIELDKVPIPGIGVLCTRVHVRFPEEAADIIKTHKDRRAPGSINALGRQTPPSNIAYRSNSFSETPVRMERHIEVAPQVTVEPKTVMDIKPVAPLVSAVPVVAKPVKCEPVCATPKTELHFCFPTIGRKLTPSPMVDLDCRLAEPSAVVPRVSVAPSVDLGKNLSAQPVGNFRMESAFSPETDELVQQVIYSAVKIKVGACK